MAYATAVRRRPSGLQKAGIGVEEVDGDIRSQGGHLVNRDVLGPCGRKLMPRTVDEGFRNFLARLTPSSGESAAAKKHRESIEQCIRANFGLNRFWRTGSFGNGTSIWGYSDVDYMASIPSKRLKRNSTSSLTELRNALATRFPDTGVRSACPVVVVPFGADRKETTEVTPADYVGTRGKHAVYEIPNRDGSWMRSSPDAHNSYVGRLINRCPTR